MPNWTGFYLGADAGFVWTGRGEAAYEFVTGRYFSQTVASNAVLAGSYAGFNVQNGPVVFGMEGDFEAAGLRRSQGGQSVIDAAGRQTIRMDSDFQASLRGRLGYAAGQSLLYLTAGAAVAHRSVTQVDPGWVQQQSFSSVLGGWTLGAGLEHAFTDYWSARIEYRFSDLGTSTFTSIGYPQFILQEHLRDNVARLGISLKFD